MIGAYVGSRGEKWDHIGMDVAAHAQDVRLAGGETFHMAMLAVPLPSIMTALPISEPIVDIPVTRAIENFGPGIDLFLAGFEVSVTPVASEIEVTVWGAIANIGDTAAPASSIKLYLSTDDTIGGADTVLETIAIAGLDAGGLIDFTTTVVLPFPDEDAAPVFMGLRADPDNRIDEVDETNNAGPVQAISLPQQAPPDPAVNIEPYVLAVRAAGQITTTQDLAPLLNASRVAEAVSGAALTAARADFSSAGLLGFDDVAVGQAAALSGLQNGTYDAALVLRDAFGSGGPPTGIDVFEIPSTPGPLTIFTPSINVLSGTAGDNTLRSTQARDLIDGGEGRDTVLIDADQSHFTLTLTPTSMTLLDRREPLTGLDSLISIETLDFAQEVPVFNDRPMRLDVFSGPTSLSTAEFNQITELYIAYFNRAPDALGLYYWGTEFDRGVPIRKTAESFFNQVETRATYANVLDDAGNLTDIDAFITAVYGNVLGRAPDAAGFDYWLNELNNNPAITPPIFILAIINGAKFSNNPNAQTFEDQRYLATKADIGAYFAIIKGLNDPVAAADVMGRFDGTAQSVQSAIDRTDAVFDIASDALTGDFLFPLVGVIDDPFAI